MRYRNPHPDAHHLPETVHEGRVYPAVEVPPGGTVEWPHLVAGFEFDPAPDELVEREADQTDQTDAGDPDRSEAAPEIETPAKPTRKRAAAASDSPEVTA